MAEPPAGDVLVSGDEREPGERWRRVPSRVRTGLLALVLVAGALVALATGVGRPEPAPPAPLGTLGPAAARVDDGGTLVRVEAELRTREPVVLRSGTILGTELVLLLDPVLTPTADAPEAVTSRIVALVEPGCGGEGRGAGAAVLQAVIAPQAGGAPLTLRSDVLALAAAREAACTPVQASVALPSGLAGVARQLEVSIRVVDPSVPVELLSLTGRGLRVALEATPLAEQVARASGVRPVITGVATVLVTDCSVEVLAPRRLVLEVQRGDERLRVRVDPGPGVVAGLDELVRRTCRRPRI